MNSQVQKFHRQLVSNAMKDNNMPIGSWLLTHKPQENETVLTFQQRLVMTLMKEGDNDTASWLLKQNEDENKEEKKSKSSDPQGSGKVDLFTHPPKKVKKKKTPIINVTKPDYKNAGDLTEEQVDAICVEFKAHLSGPRGTRFRRETNKMTDEVKTAYANAVDKRGDTLLHHLCRNDMNDEWPVCRQLVQSLLDFGGNVDAQNNKEQTPLILACRYGHPEMVELLLKHKASMDTCDDQGNTALHWACYQIPRCEGRLWCMKHLLQAGAPTEVLNDHAQTPLDYATDPSFYRMKTPEIIEELTEEGEEKKPACYNFKTVFNVWKKN